MGDIFKRIAKEWLLLVTLFVGAAFIAGDISGWFERFGIVPTSAWLYGIVFIVFGIVVIYRLVKVHSKIDEYEGQILFTATPNAFRMNFPLPDEPPLGKDEGSLYFVVRFEIWTNIDIHTSRLVLNFVYLRNVFTSWYSLRIPRKKRVI
jgi:hypothetical protein